MFGLVVFRIFKQGSKLVTSFGWFYALPTSPEGAVGGFVRQLLQNNDAGQLFHVHLRLLRWSDNLRLWYFSLMPRSRLFQGNQGPYPEYRVKWDITFFRDSNGPDLVLMELS